MDVNRVFHLFIGFGVSKYVRVRGNFSCYVVESSKFLVHFSFFSTGDNRIEHQYKISRGVGWDRGAYVISLFIFGLHVKGIFNRRLSCSLKGFSEALYIFICDLSSGRAIWRSTGYLISFPVSKKKGLWPKCWLVIALKKNIIAGIKSNQSDWL